ncbi:uncharacterized protein LOC109793986 [Cajanus cajan]|uniref:uncharacterized protein LOC109793986 n=1 Tax=Cajanus cajan TaxID=3821 RepID=UPI00098D9469|nr:uncharacterized protein LOC109793986 [Cajanus cajan]
MLVARGVTVDWECFRTVFMEKYFLESVRHAKEAEFLRLHQGGMTVSKYAMKFEHLTRFYSHGIAEAWKCRKFVDGLRYELKRVVVPMAITEFLALVEKSKVVERLEGGNRVVRTAGGPSGSKKGESQRKPYDRPQSQQGGYVARDYPHTESRYFRCHQMGHESANCPTRSRPERRTQKSDGQRAETLRSSAQRADTQRGDRPTTAGRVFALTVSTPASAPVISSELCVGCPVVMNEKKYKEEDEMLISAGQAESLLRDRAECCLLLAALSVETERVISEIDVVRDFAKVFPDEVLGLPPVGLKQLQDEELVRLLGLLGTKKAAGFELGEDEILRFRGRICLP